LKSLIASAVIIGKRRWDLHLKNGMIVKLPENNASAAWTQLALLDQEHKLLDRDIAIIDFRLPDRLIIKMASPNTPIETIPNKTTTDIKPPKARFNA
ncbi:MAG: cell division protein FtsQ/DivIB, partial [Alphaproteobacteria bacterium]|nr:cell division protein FtsQ/DivIB [Alphaproteobacteria bacterium]